MKDTFWLNNNQFPAGMPRFNKERLLKTWEQYVSGDQSVKDTLIMELLASGKEVLDYLVSRTPKLRILYDELVSVLTLRTCEWINELGDTIIDNPLAYYWRLVRCIVYACAADSVIQRSSLARLHTTLGKTLPVREPLDEENQCVDPATVIDLLYDIKSLPRTDLEREYVALRLNGFTNQEIAKKLDVTETTCSRLRRNLRNRYEDC